MFSSLNANKFQPLTIPLKDGSKFFIYFKRFNLQNIDSSPSDQSLYEIFKKNHDKPCAKPIKTQEKHYDLPTKRTLLCINLDREFIQEKIRKIFRVLGKIREIFTGSFQAKKKIGEKLQKTIYFSFVIFHKEEDLRKAFELDWFQSQINEKYRYLHMKADKSDKERYVQGLLEDFGEKDSDEEQGKKRDFLQKMQEDGFTVVLNRQGSVNLKKPQESEEKTKKKSKFRSDFYKFQTKAQGFLDEGENVEGMDPTVILKRKKRKLIEDFEKDKEKLKKIKKI